MNEQATSPNPQKSRRSTQLQTFLLVGGVFAFDMLIKVEILGGIAYVAVVLVSLNVGRPRFTVGVSILCAVLAVIRVYFAPDLQTLDLTEIVTNRLLAVFGIWIAAALGVDRIKAEDALQSSQDELEVRVESRTAELGHANEELRNEIVERERAEHASREVEDRTGIILDHALDAIVAFDSGGAIVTWNRQAETIFGWKRFEALGELLVETIIPKRYRESFLQGIESYNQSGQWNLLGQRTRLPMVNRDGREFDVEVSIAPVPWGESVLFSAFLRGSSWPAEGGEISHEESIPASAATDDEHEPVSEVLDVNEPVAEVPDVNEVEDEQATDGSEEIETPVAEETDASESDENEDAQNSD